MRRATTFTKTALAVATLCCIAAPARAGDRYDGGYGTLRPVPGPTYGIPAEPVRLTREEYAAVYLPVGVLYNVPPPPAFRAAGRVVLRARY